MKLLIVSAYPTHPGIEGNRRFIYNQVELFKRMGHDVYFLLICINGGEWIGDTKDIFNKMNDYWGDKLFVFKKGSLFALRKKIIRRYRILFNNGCLKCDDYYPKGIESFIRKINTHYRFDSVIINYYYLSKLFLKTDIPLKGIVTHDYFSFKNLLTGEKHAWLATTADQEAKALQRCNHIFALNSNESIFFEKLSPLSQIYNVFSIYRYISSPIQRNQTILFLSGKNPYNINGLNWFVNNIFPKIRNKYPNVLLRIGGGICKSLSYLEGNKNIELFGYVEDTLSFYNSGDVAINPTYQGTGLKIKTFEAISYDKVVMAHPHSMNGIYNPSDCPAFFSSCPEEWVEYLDLVWSNTSKIKEIKQNNMRYIMEMNFFVEKEYKRFFDSK